MDVSVSVAAVLVLIVLLCVGVAYALVAKATLRPASQWTRIGVPSVREEFLALAETETNRIRRWRSQHPHATLDSVAAAPATTQDRKSVV